MILTSELVERVIAGSNRPGSHHHGVEHWRGVAYNGLALAALGAKCDQELVVLFALFHDSKRENEYADPEHGDRAAAYAQELLFGVLEPERLRLLMRACRFHDNGGVTRQPTEGVCWDADRLDLPRVGIVPSEEFFSTAEGRASLDLWFERDPVPEWDELIARVSSGKERLLP